MVLEHQAWKLVPNWTEGSWYASVNEGNDELYQKYIHIDVVNELMKTMEIVSTHTSDEVLQNLIDDCLKKFENI